MKKKLLFVINTLSQAGAETALIALLYVLAGEKNKDGSYKYDIDLYVLMGQGEMVKELPARINLLNSNYSNTSVLSAEGRKYMYKHILKSLFKRGAVFCNLGYIVSNFADMVKKRNILPDKLLWRVLSDGADFPGGEYDLAVSYIEGGSAYFTADHVKARKKAVFIHIDYSRAGYTKKLDRDCYSRFDAIFPISDEVKEKFLGVYPGYAAKTKVFHNIINQERLVAMAEKGNGFDDGFSGMRILTVGRLTSQKAYPVAIEAMRLLKQDGFNARWYVLGEGPERQALAKQIKHAGLEKDFILYGAVDNPCPYYRQADLYVHATRFEGKSIAIQEAQTLGCAVIASDTSGNREQVENGVDGVLCAPDALSVKEAVAALLLDNGKRHKFGERAALKKITYGDELELLTRLL